MTARGSAVICFMPRKSKTPQLPPNDDELDLASATLTPRQERFCLEYGVCLNGTEAAKLAGYTGDRRTLAVTASRLLRKANVRARMSEILEEYTMEKREILGRLTAQARADMGDFIDPATMTVDWKKARALGITHLIKKFKQTTVTTDDRETQVFEFELVDNQAALVHLGKAHALFTDKVKLEVWEMDAVADIVAGRLSYEKAAELFDESRAAELFRLAKVPIG